MNLLKNPPEISDQAIQKFINDQLNIKQQQFTEEDLVLKNKLKIEKLLASMKYPPKFGRQENLTTYFFDYATLSMKKSQLRNREKVAFFPSLRKAISESLRTTEA